MKLIHCSDIHLDSPLCSSLSGKLAAERRAELRAAFSSLIRSALELGCDAIVIAGDLFDGTPSPSTLRFVLGEIASHRSIDFLYLPGNHDTVADRIIEAADLPDNFFVFKEGFSRRDYPDVSIGAIRGAIPGAETDFDPSRKNILVIHGQVSDSASTPDSFTPKTFADRGIDYAALGHIHSHKQGDIDGRGVWCYSGCLAGRGFDECGEKGFVLLDTESTARGLGAAFIRLPGRTIHDVELRLDGITELHSLGDAARERLSDVPGNDIVRITLTGYRDPSLGSYAEYLDAVFSGVYAHFEVKDRSRRAIFAADYEGDISVRGEFVRLVLSDGSLSEEDREIILTLGLRALDGERAEL